MNSVKTVLSLIIFMGLYTFGYSQNPVYTQLTEKDGLPDIEFYDVIEDKKGFIWLAADKGLFRYDGKEFKNYTHPDKRGLSVFGLKLDDQGKVWCNNISGQYFFVEDDKMKLFIDFKDYARGQLGSYFLFKNYLVLNYFRSTFLCDLKTKEIKRVNGIDFFNSTYKRNDTLFHLNNRYKQYSLDGATINNRKYYSEPDAVNLQYLSFLFKGNQFHYSYDYNRKESEKGFVTIEKNNRLIKVKLPKKLQSIPTIKFYVFNDDLWICTHKGLFICEYVNNSIQIKEEYFPNKEITSVIVDRNDNLWITSTRSGVFIIPNIYLKEYDLSEYATRNVSVMCKIRETELLVGTTEGDLVLFNTETGSKREVAINRKEKVFAIVELSENKALVSFGTFSVFLDTKNLTYETSTSYNANAKDFSIKEPNQIVKAAFAFASIVSSKSGKEIKRIGFKRSYTTHYNDLNKNIYVGYVDGVKVYDNELQEKPIFYNNNPIFAIDIDETNNGMVWLSTFKNGIIGVKNDSAVVNYTKKNGLPSNLTSTIKGDGENLWITTNEGIQLLNIRSQKFKNLTKRDGINSYKITDIVLIKDKLFFSSNIGVFEVDKQKVFKCVDAIDFYFTNVLINDKETVIDSVYTLDPDQTKIQFKFHINGFLAEENIQYKYRLLEGKKEGEWNLLDKGINQVTFNKLAAGNYVFEIKGVEVNGTNDTVSKKIEIKVLLPFYKKWWFILTVFLSLLLYLLVNFNRRIKALRTKQNEALEKERLQKELVSTKLETLRSQMNPHFTFNALNSIQNLILKDNKQEAYNYLTKFSSLIRENLHLSTKNFVSFEQELSLINRYLELEKLRFKESLNYYIKGDEAIDDIKIPTMIVQPYVENAIKHGLLHKKEGERRLVVEFEQEEKILICKIVDNGIGIEKSKELQKKNNIKRKSFSTKSIQERLLFLRDYYKTDIGVEYPEVATGTTVIIKIPYFV